MVIAATHFCVLQQNSYPTDLILPDKPLLVSRTETVKTFRDGFHEFLTGLYRCDNLVFVVVI